MMFRFARTSLAAALGLSLAACGSFNVNLWPFGGEKHQDRSKAPANATAYQCAGGKNFYVRNLEDGAVWLMLPDREVRLSKTGEARFANGAAVLDLSAGAATLADGPTTLKDCKAAISS